MAAPRNNNMASEFDLEIAITKTLKALPLMIMLHHVKSHQDRNQPNLLKLAWEAQLNVLYGWLASHQLFFWD
jgi:hypothetical protein